MPAHIGDSPMPIDPDSSNSTVGKRVKTISNADISKTISYITRGVELNQPRLLQRAIKLNANLRLYITAEQLKNAIINYFPVQSPTREAIMISISKISNASKEEVSTTSMDIDIPHSSQSNVLLPEVEVFLFTLVITTMIRYNLFEDAAHSSSMLINRIRMFNRRTVDIFSSKAYFYFSLAYEKINRLDSIRSTLLALYRTSCLHHDELGQAILLNLLLRNYLHYHLVDQAQNLASKAAFPEHASNNQFCRYLYYMGRIQAIQLEYSEAYARLMMAVRKAPQDSALGFTRCVHKLAIIVQLLMGEIPERATFNQPELRRHLIPYLELTQAVRNGDLQEFSAIQSKYTSVFKSDYNLTLVHRLGHHVLKIGLRKISVSYSRISLDDIAMKLHLPSAASAEYVCAKAILDGVIEASIDHENSCLSSSEVLDIYSTDEPQKALHRRITFCLDVHNEAVKSMRYPPDAYKRELVHAGKPKVEEKTVEELVKEMEDDMDEL